MGDVILVDPERTARAALACQIRNNNTQPPPGVYCEGTFDSWSCWPHTSAGSLANASCPDFVPGFSTDLLAFKECTADGTWWVHPATNRSWSNYTTCVKEEDDVSEIIAVYETCYSISLLALLLSLAILLYFKNLRCARITVHINLFVSFTLNNVLWLSWYSLVVRDVHVLNASPTWCKLLQAVTTYAMLTTYSWSLCEGIYLHTVLVYAFASERRLLRALLPFGWLLPLPAAAYSAYVRWTDGDEFCWVEDRGMRWEQAAVAAGTILLNLAFLCNIVRVLCTKLRAAPPPAARASPTVLHAVRATCFLAPLLGLQYLLTPFHPAASERGWRVYAWVAALAQSLQGLAVAALYCFLNGEVRAQLARKYRALHCRRRRSRASSNTQTTVSVPLLTLTIECFALFVRSAGAGEEKV